jgi:hypothetical protein
MVLKEFLIRVFARVRILRERHCNPAVEGEAIPLSLMV